mgnify:CR=1 FL=1
MTKHKHIDRALEYRRLSWHIQAAVKHMRIAHQIAKTLRVTKKVMYVIHARSWWPTSISNYLGQVEYNLTSMELEENEQRRKATDSTQ